MKTLRPYSDLGKTDFGWLDSRHSFSFGHYHDPQWMGFGPLRVINNDRVSGGAGFSPHSHDNMEIISYVISGGLAHGDSIGTKSVIPAGSIQLMSAGSGITHSEYNADAADPVHFFQIWVMPNVRNEAPSYQEMRLDGFDASNRLVPIITPDGRVGSLRIKQDATVSLGRFVAGQTLEIPKSDTQDIWIQIIKGDALIGETPLQDGDGMGIHNEEPFSVLFANPTELLVFFMDRA